MKKRNIRRSTLRLQGLRKRWLVNTIMPVFLLLTLLVALFSVGVSNYYYGSLQKGLETRVEVLSNSFHEYFMGSGYNSYYQKAVQAAQNFEDRDTSRCPPPALPPALPPAPRIFRRCWREMKRVLFMAPIPKRESRSWLFPAPCAPADGWWASCGASPPCALSISR